MVKVQNFRFTFPVILSGDEQSKKPNYNDELYSLAGPILGSMRWAIAHALRIDPESFHIPFMPLGYQTSGDRIQDLVVEVKVEDDGGKHIIIDADLVTRDGENRLVLFLARVPKTPPVFARPPTVLFLNFTLTVS